MPFATHPLPDLGLSRFAMEDYLVEHASRYKSLVAGFKPTNRAQNVAIATENPDTIIVSRLRPLLQDEIAGRVPQAVFERPGTSGILDVHELKKPIRGPPALPTIRVSLLNVIFSLDFDGVD